MKMHIAKMTDAGKKVGKDYSYQDAEKYARSILGLDTPEGDAIQKQVANKSYEQIKSEFFHDMDITLSHWDGTRAGARHLDHNSGSAGNLAIATVTRLMANSDEDISMDNPVLQRIKSQLADPSQLTALAKNTGSDPEMTKIALEYVFHYFQKVLAPDQAENQPSVPQQASNNLQLSLDQESHFLQSMLEELLGNIPYGTSPLRIPQATISRLLNNRDLYYELHNYVKPDQGQRPMIGTIDLTKHQNFLNVLQQVINAVDAQERANVNRRSGNQNISGMA
jgi:hypothetical protein